MVRAFGGALGLAAAAARSAPASQTARCRLDGPTLVVQHEGLSPAKDPKGDPGGQVDPWKIVGTHVEPSAVGSLFLEPSWRVGATADFNADGVCDLVWTRTVYTENMPAAAELVLTLTDASQDPPVLKAPEPGVRTEPLGPGWVLVGSGDFVGATPSQDPRAGAPDGRQDLLFWNGAVGTLGIWAGDGAGGFPLEQRRKLPGASVDRWPVVVADIDGEGLPEIIWEDASGALTYWRLASDPGDGVAKKSEGPLTPSHPRAAGWVIRGADDFDGDGIEDLIFQHEVTESALVWEMNGPQRKKAEFLSPAHLPPGVPPATGGPWVIVGPR